MTRVIFLDFLVRAMCNFVGLFARGVILLGFARCVTLLDRSRARCNFVDRFDCFAGSVFFWIDLIVSRDVYFLSICLIRGICFGC